MADKTPIDYVGGPVSAVSSHGEAGVGEVLKPAARPNKAELRRLAEAVRDDYWSPDVGMTTAETMYACAAAPGVVLSLLDECELLRNGAKGDFDLDAWLEWAKEAQALRSQNAGLIAQHGRDSVELSKQCHARDVARKERDKAEAERDAALAELKACRKDAERLDRLDKECEAYGFEGIHEGNRWMIDGPFRTVRDAIDAAMSQEAHNA